MNRRVSRIEKRRGGETTTGKKDKNEKRGESEERTEREEGRAGRGSRIHGRYHEALTSVAAAAA